jgi:hypothetical protein
MLAVDGNIIGAIIGVGGAVCIAVASGAWKLARSMGSIEQLVRDMNRSQEAMAATLASHADRITALEARSRTPRINR